MSEAPTRTIYYGDNLDILRQHIPPETVNLVYLDPPFNSQQDYNVLFRTARGEHASAQVRAFSDTWRWNSAARATYEWLIQDPLVPGKVARMVEAFHQFLGPSEMLAYLVMMTPRLMALHRVLKPTGSIYVHCDPGASHYLKVVLDAIFGPQNFRNEIVWKRSHAHSSARRYGPIHDVLLFYSKSSDYTWTEPRVPYASDYVAKYFKFDDSDGRGPYWTGDLTGAGIRHGQTGLPWRGFDPTAKGRHWMFPPKALNQLDAEGRIFWPKRAGIWPKLKRYLREAKGVPLQDIFDDIYGLQTMGGSKQERLGYPTQKPVALLRRVIQASTNPGELVLDPFCGCGTALVAAEELGRSWMGIDITYLAVDVMARRLREHFPGITFEIRGEPQDEEGARALAERDRFQFQVWALSRVGAQPLGPDRRGADRGIDGYLPFLRGQERFGRAIVQVKSGRVGPRDIRDLRGTLERESAPFALFITLEPATDAMKRDATEAGFYKVQATGEDIPRLQIITVSDLLRGQKPRLPTTRVAPTPRAPRIARPSGVQPALGLDAPG